MTRWYLQISRELIFSNLGLYISQTRLTKTIFSRMFVLYHFTFSLTYVSLIVVSLLAKICMYSELTFDLKFDHVPDYFSLCLKSAVHLNDKSSRWKKSKQLFEENREVKMLMKHMVISDVGDNQCITKEFALFEELNLLILFQ